MLVSKISAIDAFKISRGPTSSLPVRPLYKLSCLGRVCRRLGRDPGRYQTFSICCRHVSDPPESTFCTLYKYPLIVKLQLTNRYQSGPNTIKFSAFVHTDTLPG